MKPFYCAGNWKMNKTPAEAVTFVRKIKETANAAEQKAMVLLPPALIAHAVAAEVVGSSLNWGGQNCYHADKGAFTGETSPAVLKSMGAHYCLVGHSERRQIFGELDETLAMKVAYLQQLDLIPILCVGETLDDRRWNRTQEVILRQLRTGLQNSNPAKPVWIAYEPVWAIGTGQVATPEQVEDAHGMLRTALREWNQAAGEKTPILYGGSVKPENSAGLAALKNVDGFLIGGASLDPDEFLKILRNSKS